MEKILRFSEPTSPETSTVKKTEEFDVPNRNGNNSRIVAEKDSNGRIINLIENKKIHTMMWGRVGDHDYISETSFKYDKNGNIVHELENSSDKRVEVSRKYDDKNRLTEEIASGESFGNWHQATSRNDQKETKTNMEYDDQDRIVRKSIDSGTNWSNCETKYDDQGRVSEVRYEDDSFKSIDCDFTYDENGNPLTCRSSERYWLDKKEEDVLLKFNSQFNRWEQVEQ